MQIEECKACRRLAGMTCADCDSKYVLIPIENILQLEMLLTNGASSNRYTRTTQEYFKKLRDLVRLQSLRMP